MASHNISYVGQSTFIGNFSLMISTMRIGGIIGIIVGIIMIAAGKKYDPAA